MEASFSGVPREEAGMSEFDADCLRDIERRRGEGLEPTGYERDFLIRLAHEALYMRSIFTAIRSPIPTGTMSPPPLAVEVLGRQRSRLVNWTRLLVSLRWGPQKHGCYARPGDKQRPASRDE